MKEFKAGKKIAEVSLRKLLTKWLRSDEPWGSHASANQMRYMDSSPLEPKIDEALMQSDHSVLAIITYPGDGAVARTMTSILARITLHPLSISPLKFLEPSDSYQLNEFRSRFVRQGNKTFVKDGQEMLAVNGRKIRIVGHLPPG